MMPGNDIFDRSIAEQIAINRARTPTGRLQALCDLLDAIRAMAPQGEEARQRRCRALKARQAERERFSAECRRLLAAQRSESPADF
jgi:hypothetical protein